MKPARTALAALTLLAATAAPAQTAERPVAKVGDSTVFAVQLVTDRKQFDDTVTTTAVEPTLIRYRHSRPERVPADIEALSTPDLDTVRSGYSGTLFEPSAGGMRFPLTGGQRWKAEGQSTSASGAQSRFSSETVVSGVEKLRVPAGEYDTFRVDSKGWITGVSWNGSMRFEQSQWYAPAAGRVVRTEYRDWRGGTQLWNHSIAEMKAFRPGP